MLLTNSRPAAHFRHQDRPPAAAPCDLLEGEDLIGARVPTAGGLHAAERLLAILGAFFAIVALTLAAAGVYGLFAHLTTKRVPEIGIRLALGARPYQMMLMTLRENLVLALLGSAIGVACAIESLRVLEGFLFGLTPIDSVSLAGAALILVLVSLAAAVVPARRAASVDPLVALRYE